MIRFPGRFVRHVLLVTGTAAALLGPVPTASAHAHQDVDLDCSIIATSDVYPGEIFGVLQHLVGTTHGLTGTADCTGTVDGQQVTGQGQFGANSQEYGDCGATETTGRNEFILRVPTAHRTKTVTGIYADHIKTAGGTVTIELTGDITGTSWDISAVGQCTEADPLTQVTFGIQGHVT
jgi:hypothetical protein